MQASPPARASAPSPPPPSAPRLVRISDTKLDLTRVPVAAYGPDHDHANAHRIAARRGGVRSSPSVLPSPRPRSSAATRSRAARRRATPLPPSSCSWWSAFRLRRPPLRELVQLGALSATGLVLFNILLARGGAPRRRRQRRRGRRLAFPLVLVIVAPLLSSRAPAADPAGRRRRWSPSGPRSCRARGDGFRPTRCCSRSGSSPARRASGCSPGRSSPPSARPACRRGSSCSRSRCWSRSGWPPTAPALLAPPTTREALALGYMAAVVTDRRVHRLVRVDRAAGRRAGGAVLGRPAGDRAVRRRAARPRRHHPGRIAGIPGRRRRDHGGPGGRPAEEHDGEVTDPGRAGFLCICLRHISRGSRIALARSP